MAGEHFRGRDTTRHSMIMPGSPYDGCHRVSTATYRVVYLSEKNSSQHCDVLALVEHFVDARRSIYKPPHNLRILYAGVVQAADL